jgi:hypothetical protein
MKFQVNDKVEMTNDCNPYWTVGDIGRIVAIDNSSVPYLVCFDSSCESSYNCDHQNACWAGEESIQSTNKKYRFKFKLNAKVKMLTTTGYWDKGDVGRIVKIDSDFGPNSAPYLVCFDTNCTDAAHCGHRNIGWANESSIGLAHQLMKVD